MILGRNKILELIKNNKLIIEPFEVELVKENGIDLRLAPEYAIVVEKDSPKEIDVETTNPKDVYYVNKNIEKIVIPPRGFILACTLEYIKLPNDVVGLCNLRSTLARWGLSIPPTVVDAGFSGQLTIEIINNTPNYIILKPYTPFLHLILVNAQECASYKGHYQNQRGVTLPKNVKPFKQI